MVPDIIMYIQDIQSERTGPCRKRIFRQRDKLGGWRGESEIIYPTS